MFKDLHVSFFRKSVWIFAIYAGVVFGQENETVRDSTSNTFSLGRIALDGPNSIVSKYEFDPVTNRYIYREMLGQFNVQYPRFLTPEEYEALVDEEQRRLYFKDKIDAFSGRKEGSKEKRKNLLPVFMSTQIFSNQFLEETRLKLFHKDL